MARVTPKLNPVRLAQLGDCTQKWLEENLTPLTHHMEFEEYLLETSFSETRKNQLRDVNQRMHGTCPRNKINKIKSFQKTESYAEFKLPRWINSRSDYFKVVAGPWCKLIEQQLYKVHHFIKHVPVPNRPALISQLQKAGAQIIATDYTSFEASFVPEVMQMLECKLFKHMLKNYPKVADLLCKATSGKNQGYTKAGVFFEVLGRRMSGDMWTSLANGFSNLMVFNFLMGDREWDGYVEGDDGIFAVYDDQPVPTAEQYSELGFTIKLEKHDSVNTANFCGIISADGQNVKDPRKVLQNFGWTASCLEAGDNVMNQLLRAKALSLAYEMPQCPVVRAIADRALFLTRGVLPRFEDDGYHTTCPTDENSIPVFRPSSNLRQLFSQQFGLAVDTQLVLEERIRASNDLDFLSLYIAPPCDMATYAAYFVDEL